MKQKEKRAQKEKKEKTEKQEKPVEEKSENARAREEFMRNMQLKALKLYRERVEGLEEEVQMLSAYVACLIDRRIDQQGGGLRIPKSELQACMENCRYLISSDRHAYYIRRVE